MFRARLPSIFSTSHKMPRLPQNLHVVTTGRSPDNAIRKNHATRLLQSAAPATQNEDGQVQSAAPATKTKTHLLKTSQKYCACHAKPLSTSYETRLNLTKCHACHAKRSNATLETFKSDPCCRILNDPLMFGENYHEIKHHTRGQTRKTIIDYHEEFEQAQNE